MESEAPRVLVETSLATSKITITPSSGLSASSAGGVTRYDNAPLEPTRGPSKKLRSRPRKLATKKDCDPASSTIIGDSIWQRVGDGLGMLPRSKLPTNSSDEAILYNQISPKVFLQPELILCAIFGEFFESVDGDAYRFSGLAAMAPERNTRVNAVLGILPIRMQRNCIEAGRMEFELSNGFSRELTDEETYRIHHQTAKHIGQVEKIMRVVVVENPYASKPLPEHLFRGPFDERWAQGPGIVRLKFSGTRIAEMRALLPEYALKMMGVW